ncbi:MAG: helix-turn-helix transcriptional regulator [Lachnospiraceae bacterium]
MRTLETNDWIMLNSMIYKIYTMEDFNQMRSQFLEQIKMLVDFDSADFYLAATDGEEKLANPVFYNCEEDLSEVYDGIDYSRGILYSGKSLIYRETDIISDESRVETEYYKKVYKPNNWHYSLQMILAREKEFVGVITFYRTIGKDNFQYDDIFLLDMLKDHLAYRLYQQKKKGELLEEKLTVSAATRKYELTRREHTILQLLMEGKTNPDICDELSITENTLKKHILNIYRKLGIKNRVQMFKMIKEKE